MRIATLNASTLTGRLTNILDKCFEDDIDIICIQETRINHHAWPGLTKYLRKYKYSCVFGHTGKDTRGQPIRGCLIFSRWHCNAVAWEGPAEFKDRIAMAAIHRPQQQAFLLAGQG